MRGMVSFLAGFGGGYLKASEKAQEQKRQDEQDAWQKEQRGRQRKDWEKADELEKGLQDAVKPQAVEQPNDVLKDDDGNDMPAVPAYRVGGQRYTTMDEATKAAADANTPEAQAQRQIQAYRNAGKASEALAMETAMRQGKLGEIQLAETQFKQRLGNWMAGGFDGFRDGINAYEAGPFAGKKIDYIVSDDGKTRTVALPGDDGKLVPTSISVPNTNEGVWQLGYLLDRTITPAQRVEMIRADKKDAREERKTAVAEQQANTAERKLDVMMTGILARNGNAGGGAGSRVSGGGSNAGATPPSFDPYEGFDPKNAQSAATQLVDDAIAQGGKPVAPQERAKLISEQVFKLRDAYATQNANRQRASVFMSEARQAKTPEQVEAVRQRAKASGYSDTEMAALDPRFATMQTNYQDTNSGPKEINFAQLPGKKLAELAKKPRGVSSYEAAQAQQELDRRKSAPQELKAW